MAGMANAAYSQKQWESASQEVVVAQLTPAYPAALKQARARRSIENASVIRSRIPPHSDCLRQGQVEGYRTKIVAQ